MSYLGKVRPTVALTSSDITDGAVIEAKIGGDAVTSAKINDGAIVDADVNASASIAQSKLATLVITDSEVADNALSGNKIDGGTISNFASTGMDDNADATAITIDSSEQVGLQLATTPAAPLHVKVTGGSGTETEVARFETTGTNDGSAVVTDWRTAHTRGELNLVDGTGSYDSEWVFKNSSGSELAAPTTQFRIASTGYLYAQNLPGGASGGTYDMRWISSGADSYFRYDSSSARYKENITDINFDTSPVYNLRPVSFDEKPMDNPPDSYVPFLNDVGLIAEEVHEHIPALVTYKDLEDGNGPVPDAVNYSKLAVILLNEIKKLNERIKVLEGN